MSETHFTDRNYFSIRKYRTRHTQHPDATAHGGIAVIISERIPHFEMDKYEEDYLQATSIKIKDSSGSLTIAAIYCPLRQSVKKEQFKKFFDSLQNRFIAGGDYNAKDPQWGSRLINPKGRKLHKTLSRRRHTVISAPV